MLGSWMVWLTIGVVGTGLIGLVASKEGQRWLKKYRKMLARRAATDTKLAVLAASPRARLRAEKRAKRKAQPPRLTFGHRRAPDDPSRVSKAARWAARRARQGVASQWDNYRVARVNRRAERRAERRRHRNGLIEILTLEWEAERARSQGLCGSTNTDDGHPCQNLRMIGQPRCQVHTPNSVA